MSFSQVGKADLILMWMFLLSSLMQVWLIREMGCWFWRVQIILQQQQQIVVLQHSLENAPLSLVLSSIRLFDCTFSFTKK